MANYYISEYNYGKDGDKPHNFVTIGGVKQQLKNYAISGENDAVKQFRWLQSLNLTMINSAAFINTITTKRSDHQLVINTSSSKLKIIFLNNTIRSPPSEYVTYSIVLQYRYRVSYLVSYIQGRK